MTLRNVLRRIFQPAAPSAEQVSSIERGTYGPCLLCGEDLSGHDRAQLGSLIVKQGDSTDLDTFDAAAREHNWLDVSSRQEWEGMADEVVYSLLRCPWSLQLCLARLESFASMDLDDRVTARQLLTDDESKQLEAQVPLEWHRI